MFVLVSSPPPSSLPLLPSSSSSSMLSSAVVVGGSYLVRYGLWHSQSSWNQAFLCEMRFDGELHPYVCIWIHFRYFSVCALIFHSYRNGLGESEWIVLMEVDRHIAHLNVLGYRRSAMPLWLNCARRKDVFQARDIVRQTEETRKREKAMEG